jgi:RNA polymerase sigma-70 factor (ECF subfamily)
MFSRITLSSHNDQEILRNIAQNGPERRKAEEELFTSYSYFIKQGIIKYSLQEDDAIDAYSDTILSAIQTITKGAFESRSSLKTYLFRIFNNKCVDILRKNTTNKRSVYHTYPINDMLMHLSDSARSVVQKLIDEADFDNIKRKLNELGETCRQLLMQFADGYSDPEIALSMNYKSADVVKTTRLRCLEKLRQLYSVTKQK